MKTRLFVLVLVFGVIAGLLWLQPPTEPEARDVQPVSPAPSVRPPDHLFEITYVLRSSTGFALLEDTTMEMAFSDKSDVTNKPDAPQNVIGIWFNAGCNNFYGDFRITSETLESTEWHVFTEMGCDGSLHEQERWLGKFLMDGPRMTVSADGLTLAGDTATLSFLNKKVADPDRPLVGQQWTAYRYIDRGSLSWVNLETYPTLFFSEDGVLRIFDGCNQLEGRFAVNGSELTVANVVSISEHYDKVFADGSLTLSFDANALTIERGENGVVGLTD